MESGDLLEVRYGDSIQHSDFENAVYRQSQYCPPPHDNFGCHDSARPHGALRNPAVYGFRACGPRSIQHYS